MIFAELFWAWFQIGLFSIGGGYAALPIIKNMIVDNYGWLTVAQFADLVVIDQTAPGPIILNSATFVGVQVAGLPGAIVATTGCLTGPTILLFIVAWFYFRYKELPVIQSILKVLRPVVVGLIASAGVSIAVIALWGENGFSPSLGHIDYLAVVIMIAAIAVMRKVKVAPELVMLGCGVLGGAGYYFLPNLI